jgi:hypothetical protein
LELGAEAASARQAPVLAAHIESTIREVRLASTVEVRRQRAEQLDTLVLRGGRFPASRVTEITALLKSSDDVVRYWIAQTLGDIGPEAKSAIPALEKLLPSVECLNGPVTSAGAIHYALHRLGVKPPFSSLKCPNRISG